MNNSRFTWIIHESRLPQMRGVVHEAVLCTASEPQRSRCGKIGLPER